MTAHRNKNAWIWVAIAAITLASVSRAEAGAQGAKAYAHPILQFLAKSYSQSTAAHPAAARFAQRSSAHSLGALFRDSRASAWTAFLPVCFVGLVSPLSLFTGASSRGRVPAAPSLPASFQRPPPALV
ncbi:MAG TPA: hypothetical protein VG893_09790 [Terracidiphilus sp.]|nr:hypothetical protein [Terracidiphilus sp.]